MAIFLMVLIVCFVYPFLIGQQKSLAIQKATNFMELKNIQKKRHISLEICIY